MKKLFIILAMVGTLFAAYENTASGTVITSLGSSVTVSYDVGGATRTANSADDANITVVGHGGVKLSAVAWVESPAVNSILAGTGSSYAFSVANSGNLTEIVAASIVNPLGGFAGTWLSSLTDASLSISREGVLASSLAVTADVGANDGDTGELTVRLASSATSVYGEYASTNGYIYAAGTTENINAVLSFSVSAPEVSITKSVTVSAPADYIALGGAATDPVPGAVLTYTIDYENTGSADAAGVVITDIVPASTEFATATGGTSINYDYGAGWDASAPAVPVDSTVQAVRWNMGVIAASTSGSVTFTVVIK